MLGTDQEINDHTAAFLDCTLPEPAWSHLGHFAAALCLLRRQGLETTVRTMPDQIRRYNLSLGNQNTDTEGYHHTITLASLRAAQTILDDAGTDAPLCACLEQLMASPFGGTRWLQSYWSTPTLMSVEARQGWVPPDLPSPAWLLGQ